MRISDWSSDVCSSDLRWEYTSPVGSFPANAFGLHDMLGNAWQWLEDCYHESYTGAPADGTPRMTGECKNRVARGGCWLDSSQFLRAANRGKNWGIRYSSLGFRVARDRKSTRLNSDH